MFIYFFLDGRAPGDKAGGSRSMFTDVVSDNSIFYTETTDNTIQIRRPSQTRTVSTDKFQTGAW